MKIVELGTWQSDQRMNEIRLEPRQVLSSEI